jgi:hypothetical protein
MSDEAMALALLLSTLDRIAVAVERIADALDDHAEYFEASNAPDTKPEA